MATGSKLAAFKLGDDELAAIQPATRGRQAQPSVYTAEVQQSLTTGEAFGIKVTATVKAPYISAQLRKAAKQLSTPEKPVKVQVWDRSERVDGDPFVGFKALYAEPVTDEAKAS